MIAQEQIYDKRHPLRYVSYSTEGRNSHKSSRENPQQGSIKLEELENSQHGTLSAMSLPPHKMHP